MKRRLDLVHAGWKLLAVTVIFLAVIPGLARLGGWLLANTGREWSALSIAGQVSFAFGLVLLAVFIALVVAEQVQDHLFDVSYRKRRKRKLEAGNGSYECQFCGSRKLTAADRECPVCGREVN
ncbi:MAG: hypothetical protein EHM70_07370 [Chloroflexota bacterium]|nr:MAG: hypothetical protein EHM70_07370 [Chloroflexota bacterium]